MLLCASMVAGTAVPAFAAETESSAEAYTETISVTEEELEEEADAEETSNEADNEAEEAPEESQEESQDEPEDELEEPQDEESQDEPEESQDEESQDESEDEPEETQDEESQDESEDESEDTQDEESQDESEDEHEEAQYEENQDGSEEESEDTQDEESQDEADNADQESQDEADSADQESKDEPEKENADSENSDKFEISLYDDNYFPGNVTVTFPETASAGEEVEIMIDDLTDDQYIFWVQYKYVDAYGHGEADRVSGDADSGYGVYNFTMPEHDICIVIDIENKTPITIEETEHGTITVDPEKAATDETIRLTAEAEAGYVLDEWTVMGYKDDFDQPIRVSDDCFKIGIPFDSVTVSAKFVEDPDCYSITVDELFAENVAVNCPVAAKAGEEVKIEITGFTKDQYIHWIRFTKTLGEGIGEAVKVSGDADSGYVYSFTMPESDILLFLDIQNRTPITVEETEHGTIAVSSEKAEVNEKIRLVAEPEPGYMLDKWTVTGYKDDYGQPLLVENDADEDGAEYFEMGIPFEYVTVSAKFVEDPDSYFITVDDLIPENVVVNCPAAAKAGEEVKVEISGLTEDQYIYWIRYTKNDGSGIGEVTEVFDGAAKVSDGAVEVSDGAAEVSDGAESSYVYSFTMPESDILLFPNIQNKTLIEVIETEHGKIAVSSEKAKAGDKIYLIAEPDTGYVLDEWTIMAYRDNYGQPLRVENDSEGAGSEGEISQYFEIGIPFENVTVSAAFVPQKETSFDVNILWDDEENAEKRRPENVIVHLFADGQEVNADGTPLADGQNGADGAILAEGQNGANGAVLADGQDGAQSAVGQTGTGIVITPDQDGVWKHSFTGMPATRIVDGKVSVITYSVTQEDVPEYKAEIDGLNITNTYIGSEVLIRSATASFGENFKLNFYFLIPDSVMKDEGAYVQFTGGLTPETVPLQKGEKTDGDEGEYRFSHFLVAAELHDQINVQLFNSKGQKIRIMNEERKIDYTDTGIEYSLNTYFKRMKEKSPGSDMSKLAQAAIDYCTAVQIYFGYNAEGLSVSDAVKAVTLDDLDSYKATATGTLPEGVSISGISLMFETDNSLRVYLEFDKDKDPYSYSYTIDGRPAQLQSRDTDGSLYLTVGGVPTYYLGEKHTYTISDGINTCTVTASAMAYGQTSVEKGESDRQNLGKALLLYYQATRKYFD